MPAATTPAAATRAAENRRASERIARHAGLVYVDDRGRGIRRRGSAANGFRYLEERTRRPVNGSERKRIQALAIPPAYRDVWICPDPRGHLQASGRDARGRKQYRYHPLWHQARDRAKFDRIVAFADALPRLRRRVARDLARRGLPQEKVIATIVRLLDTTRVRVGNREYARDNGTYGLTTLRDGHVHFTRAGRVVLDFNGKGGARHCVEVTEPRIAEIVRRCRALRGRHLFQFEDGAGGCRPVSARQVNEYLREHLGGDFTAKDFRTWAATLRAGRLLARTAVPDPPSQRRLRAAINSVVEQVAHDLHNTPAVCRRSYICPTVFDDWIEGRLPLKWSGRRA
jgi:DNA topoisomerase IB